MIAFYHAALIAAIFLNIGATQGQDFPASFETSKTTTAASVVKETDVKIAYTTATFDYFKSKKLLNCESCVCKNSVKVLPYRGLEISGSIENLKHMKRNLTCGTKTLYCLYARKGSYDMSWNTCCGLGLTPASFENKQVLSCLNNHKFFASEGNIFWTSQIDSTLDRKFISCTSGNTVPADVWLSGEPDNVAMREACVAVKTSSKGAGLMDVRCGEQLPIICEEQEIPASFETSKTTTAVSVVKETDVKIAYTTATFDYFKSKKLLNCESCVCKNSVKKSNDVFRYHIAKMKELNPGCGTKKLYHLQNRVTYDMVWQACCASGLVPASFENKQLLHCLKNFKSSSTGEDNKFWTSHIDSTLDRRFVSCTSGNIVPSDVWLSGEPDNVGMREACVAVMITSNGAGLIDLRCGEERTIICEVPASNVEKQVSNVDKIQQKINEVPPILNENSVCKSYNKSRGMKCINDIDIKNVITNLQKMQKMLNVLKIKLRSKN